MRPATFAAVVLALALPRAALAGDVVTTPAPGIELLHRTTAEPQDIWVARVDLASPNVALHASADAMNVERHVTTPTFAKNTGSFVAINGDWSDATTPVGLAISEGTQWHSHIKDDKLGGEWGFLGCTIGKACTLGVEKPLDTAWWFSTPTKKPYRFFQAIGANGVPLILAGKKKSGCFDTKKNPRSAACMEADGVHLRLVVVDGRTKIAAGMTCDETRDLLVGLGCHDAVMLDGGGSSTLVVDGKVKNNPSDGAPRVVANHLGVVYNASLDPSCKRANGRWCEGTVIKTCEAGSPKGQGDCGKFGAGCQEDGDYAFCVDPKCPNGDGNGVRCTDATHVESCNDGAIGGGDCAVFGLVCGTDALGAGCMDARCTAGPHSSVCASPSVVGTCTDGAYAEAPCPGDSQCDAGLCVDPRCKAPDGSWCEGSVHATCAKGAYATVDCAASGEACVEGVGCTAGSGGAGSGGSGGAAAGGAGPGWGGASAGGAGVTGGVGGAPPAAPASSGASPDESSGCSAAPHAGLVGGVARYLLAVLTMLLASRARRRGR